MSDARRYAVWPELEVKIKFTSPSKLEIRPFSKPGLSGLAKSSSSQCCVVRCKKISNGIIAPLLHRTAMLPNGRCYVTFNLSKIRPTAMQPFVKIIWSLVIIIIVIVIIIIIIIIIAKSDLMNMFLLFRCYKLWQSCAIVFGVLKPNCSCYMPYTFEPRFECLFNAVCGRSSFLFHMVMLSHL